MSQYIDVSLPVTSTLPCWPNSPNIELSRHLDLEKGDEVNDTKMSCSVHTGTHIDAPLHYFKEGKSIDLISLDALLGPAYVADLRDAEIITENVLEKISLPNNTKRLLLHTSNSDFWQKGVKEFQNNFVALTPDAADWLVKKGIVLIGIDYLSIEGFYAGSETHLILLEAEVVILEGLNLTGVTQGKYELYCLPIKLQGVEAAPTRAVLKGPF